MAATNNNSEPSSGDMAVIGEGTPNRTPISIQVLQNIYHELTGKSEEISKSYTDSFLVSFKDFEQLDHRVNQTCEQYQIAAQNCSIKVFYINDTQETFSSFERFRAFNAGSASSVESVLLVYNFLIILPKLGQPQSYTLSIRLASKVAIQNKLRNEMSFDLPKIMRLMGGRTAVVSVKYIDYAVARNLLNNVDEWCKSISKSQKSPTWDYIQKHSSYLPLLTRYIVGLIVASIVLYELPKFITSSATLFDLAKFLLCASVGIFSAYKLADHLGSAAEDSVDQWSEMSYISLTSGDKTEIEKAAKGNRSNLWGAALRIVGAMLVSLVAKIIVAVLTS